MRANESCASVYPRSRGEQPPNLYQVPKINGLSPLARGTVRKNLQFRWRLRFIPARAGNRSPLFSVQSSGAVYPRSRGEQRNARRCGNSYCGLSPLARGTVLIAENVLHCARFIPARAGNSAEWSSEMDRETVYPRSRGEQRGQKVYAVALAGLSPLARGTGAGARWRKRKLRFIPARAGNRLFTPRI